MNEVMAGRRASRWTRSPVLRANGTPVAVCPTDRDIAIFELLSRFDILPANYIHAFVAGNAKALGRRLNILSRNPNNYLMRPLQQRQHFAANQRPLIYQLDRRGLHTLRDRGRAVTAKQHRNFPHDLMVALVTASIELGTRQYPHLRLITWSEILLNEKTPVTTRVSGSASVQVSCSFLPERHSVEIRADGWPFGLERLIGGVRSYLFFPGIEADCATEPLNVADSARSSIARKFAAYLAVAEQGLYRSHFGFPNFFVPFVTTSANRVRSMMSLLDRMTAGQGSKMFLFKTFPAYTLDQALPSPDGVLFAEPWQRVGHPPLYFDR